MCGDVGVCCECDVWQCSVEGDQCERFRSDGKKRDVSVRMIQLFHAPMKQNTHTTQLGKDLVIEKHINILKGTFKAD